MTCRTRPFVEALGGPSAVPLLGAANALVADHGGLVTRPSGPGFVYSFCVGMGVRSFQSLDATTSSSSSTFDGRQRQCDDVSPAGHFAF